MYKRNVRAAPKAVVYTKSLARLRARAGSGRRSARVGRSIAWKGGFNISRMGVTWCLNNAASAGGVLVATPNIGYTGTSAFNFGTPVLVSGAVGASMYEVPFSVDFSLDSLSQFSDLQQICDRYMIYKVELRFWSPYTSALGQSSAGAAGETVGAIPRVHYVTDHDDNTPGTVQQVKEKMGLRSGAMSQGKTTLITVYPRVAPLVQNASGTAFTVPTNPMFINTATANVPHYGLKGYLANVPLPGSGPASGSTVIMVDTKYFIKTRDLQ